MTNTELIQAIKAEIERIASRAMNEEGQDLCEYLLSFLSTSEPEKPIIPDDGLKKEIDAYFKDWYVDESDQGYSLKTPTGSAVMGNMEDVARHFYEIGCRRTAEMYDEIEYNRQMAEERQMAKEIPNDLTGTRY